MSGDYKSLEEEDRSDGYGSADPRDIDKRKQGLYQGLEDEEKLLIYASLFTLAALGAGLGVTEGMAHPGMYNLAEYGSEMIDYSSPMTEEAVDFASEIVKSL